MTVLLTTLIIMLWLISCAGCVGIGYFYALKKKTPPPKRESVQLTDLQKAQIEREKRQMDRFYSFDGFDNFDGEQKKED